MPAKHRRSFWTSSNVPAFNSGVCHSCGHDHGPTMGNFLCSQCGFVVRDDALDRRLWSMSRRQWGMRALAGVLLGCGLAIAIVTIERLFVR
ncbi:hypothetical protein [Rubrimonas cliftonensis]|uniref:Uncharacterized protein n=1 Tax=Rubrimonas cliftonensis TaxID=89524 RepID=A0A1H3ZDU2_9RHOB|nr:hypothetical protein [Rubrimonas cliftonensis]SEA21698.1 hypothetical protein SAMN05444370_103493 [Rubrimonas cliftonensis]